MGERRFYCSEISAGRITLDAEQSRHALNSLRLKSGDAVVVFDGRGHVARGRLGGLSDDPSRRSAAKGRLAQVDIEAVEHTPAAALSLTVLVAGCKGPRLAWMVEKCTELGVAHIALAEFVRSTVRVSSSHARKLRRTAVEASKQCGRVWLPTIEVGIQVGEIGERAGNAALAVAHPCAEAQPFATWLDTRLRNAMYQSRPAADLGGNTPDSYAVVIGPEGGLTPDEVSALTSLGATPVRLAMDTLRVETAAVSAAAVWAAQAAIQQAHPE